LQTKLPPNVHLLPNYTFATIAKYKTSFTLFLPICLAIELAGMEDEELYEAINDYNDSNGAEKTFPTEILKALLVSA